MTTSKVAPLTGALLARKGTAAPATLTPTEEAEAAPSPGPEPAAPATEPRPEPALTADMLLAGVAKGRAIRLADTAPRPNGTRAQVAKPAPATRSRMPPRQVAAIGAIAAVAALAGAWIVERTSQPAPVAAVAPESPAPEPAAPVATVADVAALAAGLADEVRPAVDESAAYVELVRVEPGGTTLIAGPAAPQQDVVVLDNGRPIGTASTDAAGAWLFMADSPLDPGSHEIGVAVAAPTTVQVTGPDAPAVEVAAPAVPAVPVAAPPAPVPQAAAGARYFVQLASVKTSAAAERAWRTLQGRLGEVVAGMTPVYDTAAVAERGSFVRVRVGPFADRATADALCDKVLARTGDCLVVRRN